MGIKEEIMDVMEDRCQMANDESDLYFEALRLMQRKVVSELKKSGVDDCDRIAGKMVSESISEAMAYIRSCSANESSENVFEQCFVH